MVVDTSALLAVAFRETHGEWCRQQMFTHRSRLYMSSVNFAEVLILLRSKQPTDYDLFRAELRQTPLKIVAPTEVEAEIAAAARFRYPLNFGDCFAYALAKSSRLPLLTLDTDFRNTDLKVISPPQP